MLGTNQLAGEVLDVVSSLRLLKEHGLQKVVLHADGESCVTAAIASLFSPVAVELKLSNRPENFKKYLVDTKPMFSDAFLVKMHGFLQYMDLDDLFQVIHNNKSEYKN